MVGACVLRLTIALCVMAGPAAGSETQPDVETLLARAPSPAVEALLLPHVGDARVPARWRELLAHRDAALRVTAARLIGAGKIRILLGGVHAAIPLERDPLALAELLRALAIIGSDAADPMIHAHLSRAPLDAQRAVLVTLATLRPAAMAARLTGDGPLAAEPRWVRIAFGRLARIAPAHATSVELAAMHRRSPRLVEGVLLGAADIGRMVPPALVAPALDGDDDALIAASLVYLARIYGAPERVRADRYLAAERVARDVPRRPTNDWLATLRSRWLGDPLPSPATTAQPQPAGHAPVLPRAVLAAVEPGPRDTSSIAQDDEAWLPIGPPAVRMLSDIPAALVLDLARETRCVPAPADERVLQIHYGADGRPTSANVGPDPWSPACKRMAEVLYSVAYGEQPPAGEGDPLLVIRLDTAYATCLAEAEHAARAAPGVPVGHDDASRPATTWPPRYPERARSLGIDGVVETSAVVTRAGCVADVRLVRGQPWLDAAAVQAVSHWRFAPVQAPDALAVTRRRVSVPFRLP